MKILVIGGTRLLGYALVRHFLSTGHEVTVVSRRSEKCAPGAECLGGDRSQGLMRLSGRKFDFTFDFLAYDEKAVAEVFQNINPGTYVLISSAWVVRLNSSASIDECIKEINSKDANSLPMDTYNYLLGKIAAEEAVSNLREENDTATILRLPIFFGEGEHTGRVDFYLRRVKDGSPIICVDGGHNITQIVWTEDLSKAIIEWMPFTKEYLIWDGIPETGASVREIIKIIAKGAGKIPVLFDISFERLNKEFPEYLDQDPLWRERPIRIGKGNIFKRTGISPTPISDWLCGLKGKASMGAINELRNKEISYLKDFR